MTTSTRRWRMRQLTAAPRCAFDDDCDAPADCLHHDKSRLRMVDVCREHYLALRRASGVDDDDDQGLLR